MNNKDLFNAIHNVDENYIASAWDNTEADRPIVLRPEQRSGRRTARNIMLGAGGTAVAAALGFAVITGANGALSNPFSGVDDPAESTISYINDKFDNRKDGSDFDPNAPVPIDIILPDGKPLTYNDMVGGCFSQEYSFWADKYTTAEEIAQMDDLFENFYDIIGEGEDVGWDGFVLSGFAYMPEPGSDKFKRYNKGDTYCGLKIDNASASFDKNGKYIDGGIFFYWDEELADVEIIRVPDIGKMHYGGYDHRITSNDPKLTALTGGLNDEFIDGVVNIGFDCLLPMDTPVKVSVNSIILTYCANDDCYCDSEKPAITFGAQVVSSEAFDESTENWLKKDLVVPNASLSDDFNFLSNTNIAVNLGDEIRAVDDGEVIGADTQKAVIKHGEGLYTEYHTVNIFVKTGDKVKAGDVIGYAYTDYDGVPTAYYRFIQEEPEFVPEGDFF